MKKFALLSLISIGMILSALNVRADGQRVEATSAPIIVGSQGTVLKNNINVRSRPAKTAEVIDQLKKGDIVDVREHKGEWLRITAPEHTKAYVATKFVKDGVVTGDAIHVRCGAGTNFHDIGKLAKGEKLDVISTKGDWTLIKPTPECSGWVSAELIDVSTPVPVPAPIQQPEAVAPAPLPAPVVEAAPAPAPVKVEDDGDDVHIQYVVKDGFLALVKDSSAPAAYALMTEDIDGRQYIVAYLDSPRTNLSRYDGKHVRIMGTQRWKRTERYPVIAVERCEMVW